MNMSQAQQGFAQMVAKLIQWAAAAGYAVTLGEAFRTQEQAELYAINGKGIADSQHCKRLAIDLNLFINGQYKTATEDYKPLGEYWKSLNPLNRWGGDFTKRPDGNHFETNQH